MKTGKRCARYPRVGSIGWAELTAGGDVAGTLHNADEALTASSAPAGAEGPSYRPVWKDIPAVDVHGSFTYFHGVMEARGDAEALGRLIRPAAPLRWWHSPIRFWRAHLIPPSMPRSF